MSWIRAAITGGATLCLGVTSVGCSSEIDDARVPDATAVEVGEQGTTATPTATAPRPTCSSDELSGAVRAQYPGSSLQDTVCEVPFAAATITGTGEPQVALLRAGRTNWTIVATGPFRRADVAAPPEFSSSFLARYRAQFAPPTTPPPTTAAPVPEPVMPATGEADTSTSSEGEVCTASGDVMTCTPAP